MSEAVTTDMDMVQYSRPAADTRCSRVGDRRRRNLWALVYGSFRPRRRAVRRTGEQRFVRLDWHHSNLLYLAMGILLLSAMDAALTLNLLALGGSEVNALMDYFIGLDHYCFAAVKMMLTGLGVVLLVSNASWRLFGLVPVSGILGMVGMGYLLLIGYEIVLLNSAILY